jgi:replication factor A1
MRKKWWRNGSRGRSTGNSDKYRKAIESLAIIAVKNKIDSSEFFEAIIKAWNGKKSKVKKIEIVCRKKTKDSAIFLFTYDSNIAAQFFIPNEILKGKNPLEGQMKMLALRSTKTAKIINPKIKDLVPGMKKINIKAKILEIPEPNIVYTRYGTTAYITNALIGDGTGTIRMSLWNNQINTVSEGNFIAVKNGAVTRFRGDLQLRIGKGGSLDVVDSIVSGEQSPKNS